MEPTRIAIVDDRPFVSEGIEKVLAGQGGFEIVFHVERGGQLFKKLMFLTIREQPNIIILNIQLQGMSRYEVIFRLGKQYPGINRRNICLDY
ncbi:hypothetical protein A8C56_11340 [Niabella ginsenosidivorans]|uniref:Response regulatory domain-containing protein n=1 Tax=Niabella ginsenosidivorans TaxID=1176587 RepID=A0A1A9I478_9BACT|nr:hypothetical protein A8C56_11340 [Niabella ginsenosidivorans]